MQAIVSTTRVSEDNVKEAASSAVGRDWMAMYSRKPSGNSTLFELEASVAKRMEFLAWIDQLLNSPKAKSFDQVLKEIGERLPGERRSKTSNSQHSPSRQTTVLGYDGDRDTTIAGRTPLLSKRGDATRSMEVVFSEDEDLLSHLLCRYAFCMSERWRKWLVKNEEALLRARLQMEMSKDPFGFLIELMKRSDLPCEPLSEEMKSDPRVLEYVEYRKHKADPGKESEGRLQNYFTVPLTLATRLIKTRSVLCRGGQAILFRDQVQEVFLTIFRGKLNRGLHEANLARVKQQNLGDESEKATVMQMLDAFLEQFIADPADNLQEGTAGTVRPGDVQRLAQTHFPLCMRQVDSHLRREGHLKHHGRFTYGLFLKALGLSVEDSMVLFANLMTQKGGGSPEAFAKTAYGYNVRHNYGMEGKKTSYSSVSCSTVLGLPPVVDKNDCHGCPFRFRDEGALRTVLQREQPNPLGNGAADIRISPTDIEDIISDCKGQHYTRACYKHFMATHPGVKRDTLFRSPYEYYRCGVDAVEASSNPAPAPTPSAAQLSSSPQKRPETEPILQEDVIRRRI